MKLAKYSIYLISIFISLSLLSGCALLRSHAQNTPKIEVFPNQWIQLPTPKELGLNLHATQVLSATYKKDTYTSQVQVELNLKYIILVALGGWGSEVFSIKYDGNTIQSTSLPMPNADMGIKHTLTDFIFTYASPVLLKHVLASTDIRLIIHKRKRIFILHEKPVIIINYQYPDPWKGKVKLDNLKLGYKINIATVAIEKLNYN